MWDEAMKQRKLLVIDCMETLAIAMNVELSQPRIQIYLRGLERLIEPQIRYAFDQALRECRFYPQVAELLAFAAQWHPPVIDNTTRILERPDKPDDWEQLDIDQMRAIEGEVRAKQAERTNRLLAEVQNAKTRQPSPKPAREPVSFYEADLNRKKQLKDFYARNPELERRKEERHDE